MNDTEKKLGLPQKIPLTLEQIDTLENVFSWALGYLEETLEHHTLLNMKSDGEVVLLDKKDISKKINDLFWYLEKYIEVAEVKDGK